MPVVTLVNRRLATAPWARSRLARHAGRRLDLNLGAGLWRLRVREDGTLEPAGPAFSAFGSRPGLRTTALGTTPGAEPEPPADLAIELIPARLPALLGDDWTRVARIRGDAHFAADIRTVVQSLGLGVEDELARWLGGVPAHWLAGAAQRLFDTGRAGAGATVRALAEYGTEEQPVLATLLPVRDFINQVDRLRDDAERLEKRLDRVLARLRGGGERSPPDGGAPIS